jgi:hypothetical protein
VAYLTSSSSSTSSSSTSSSSTSSSSTSSSSSSKPSKSYSWKDFVQYFGTGTDLFDRPVSGTVADCQIACNNAEKCIGFSRKKNVSDKDSSQECWLKIAYPNKTMNDETWHTYSNI